MKKTRIATVSLLLISLLLLLITPASADVQATYGFCNITHNSAVDEAIGEAQLFVDVEDVSGDPNQVIFRFYNIGPDAASIADIYFDDGLLFGPPTILDNDATCQPTGTIFEVGADPANLPGGNTISPPFEATQDFNAQSSTPTQPCGVNPGEDIKLQFQLLPGVTFTDVVAALNGGVDLRIGIHVQGFDDEESEGFIACQPTAITLASFTARASGSQATLRWVTGTEISNAGFNLYRMSEKDGARVKINTKLLAATGDATSGASYSFVDSPGYGTFSYWLEDVEFSGKTTLHGPVSVTISKPLRRPAYRPVSPIAR